MKLTKLIGFRCLVKRALSAYIGVKITGYMGNEFQFGFFLNRWSPFEFSTEHAACSLWFMARPVGTWCQNKLM